MIGQRLVSCLGKLGQVGYYFYDEMLLEKMNAELGHDELDELC